MLTDMVCQHHRRGVTHQGLHKQLATLMTTQRLREFISHDSIIIMNVWF
jgi:hypothetical protein